MKYGQGQAADALACPSGEIGWEGVADEQPTRCGAFFDILSLSASGNLDTNFQPLGEAVGVCLLDVVNIRMR